MDKKMKRQVLYKPGRDVSIVLEERANQITNIDTTKKESDKPPIVRVQLSAVERSKRLYKWLNNHRLINLNGLCKLVGTDRANFIKMSDKEKEIKVEILNKFSEILKPYGYAE